MATDYKTKKDWSTAMQQFDTSTENGKALPPSKGHAFQIPTWLPRTLMFSACALIVGNVPLQSSHKTFELDQTHNYTVSTPDQQPDINVKPKIKENTKNISSSIAKTQHNNVSYKVPPSNEKHERMTLTEKLILPKTSLLILSAAESTLSKPFIHDNWTTHIITAEETTEKLFIKLNIHTELKTITNSSEKIRKTLSKLAINDIVRVEKIDGVFTQLVTHKHGERKSFVISKRNNSYSGRFLSRIIEIRQARKTLFIKKSLRYDTNKKNIPRKLVEQFIKIFDRDLKLASDLKKGDRVTLVFEELFHKGNKIGSSDILAAELIHNKRSHRAIRYTQSDKTVKYLDAEGRDLNQAFKRRALKSYKRISSHFGSRNHPIYKRVKDHHGTDYAAPRGTPISATGSGVITHIATKGGYGKTIEIKHRDGYLTRYAHMNKYAKDLKEGTKVYLGDTIGYVGSTGNSTGDHLHYEFRLNGKPLNPETVQLPKSLSLTKTEQKKFHKSARSLMRQLDVLQRFAKKKVDISIGFGG